MLPLTGTSRHAGTLGGVAVGVVLAEGGGVGVLVGVEVGTSVGVGVDVIVGAGVFGCVGEATVLLCTIMGK
ncbi:MAG: hypothetical protein Q9O62_02745 [Ardenticatenia bacterium]|nr:hypothetical protein [Ardenticatenia bacterium]